MLVQSIPIVDSRQGKVLGVLALLWLEVLLSLQFCIRVKLTENNYMLV
jgi:hypothetical protein